VGGTTRCVLNVARRAVGAGKAQHLIGATTLLRRMGPSSLLTKVQDTDTEVAAKSLATGACTGRYSPLTRGVLREDERNPRALKIAKL
jgi:hypothetical protein